MTESPDAVGQVAGTGCLIARGARLRAGRRYVTIADMISSFWKGGFALAR